MRARAPLLSSRLGRSWHRCVDHTDARRSGAPAAHAQAVHDGRAGKFPANLAELPLHERVLLEAIYRTSTAPTPVYITTHDYHAYLFQLACVAEISDVRETDVIANLLPLTPAPMGALVRSVTYA